MYKSCGFCKHCFLDKDEIVCQKFRSFRIIELEKIHPFCIDGFEFSLFKLFYWWLINL